MSQQTFNLRAAGERSNFEQGAVVERRPHRRHEAPAGECASCDRDRGKMHPSHDASPRCESGGHTHCTCDTCF